MAPLLAVMLAALAAAASAQQHHQPNILTIIADDLGFNDISFRGSNQISTPNIDALAFSGAILDRHYVLPSCTPSRTALLTGLYTIRTGLQGQPILAGEPRALPLEFRTLPEHLARIGYQTHLVGKWHLGYYKSEYTPIRRGFHHHLGYWNGYMSYFDHDLYMDVADAQIQGRLGLDMRRDADTVWTLRGEYATHLFTRRAEEVIAQHDPKAGPLYLQLAHLASHAGLNGTELEVPDQQDNDLRHGFIRDNHRRNLAGVIKEMDDSVGSVIQALQDKGMLNNTIIVFLSDNGGETEGPHKNSGSNWPLRGQKYTVYDGGVRGVAAVWSPLLWNPKSVRRDLFHISDWLPTFYEAAGGNVTDLGEIDGQSQWRALTARGAESTRSEVLVQIDQAGAIIQDNWKLVKGTLSPGYSVYSGESGRGAEVPAYDPVAVVSSPAAVALAAASPASRLSAVTVRSLRAQASLPSWCRPAQPERQPLNISCQPYCLFDLLEDPCESRDLRADFPAVGARLLRRLGYWEALTVPQLNAPIDPAADPLLHNRTWVPWRDPDNPTAAAPAASFVLLPQLGLALLLALILGG